MSEDPKCLNAKIVENPSLTAPAVRMVIVMAGVNPPDSSLCPGLEWHELIPVLAIQAAKVHRLCRGDTGRYVDPPTTLAEVKDSPWWVDESDVEYDSIVLDENLGLTPFREVHIGDNAVCKEFVAPWPADEDETRLEAEIAELKASAAAKVAKRAARSPA